jgi:hypothetical protein
MFLISDFLGLSYFRTLVQILLTDPELASKEPWSYLF